MTVFLKIINKFRRFFKGIFVFYGNLNSLFKFLIFLAIDFFILLLTPELTNYFFNAIKFENRVLINILFILIGLLIYILTGQYKSVSRFIASLDFYKIALRNITIVFFVFVISSLLKIDNFLNLGNWISFWIILTILVCSTRFILRDLFFLLNSSELKQIKKIAIYGAGVAGAKLAHNLSYEGQMKVELFVDDSKKLWTKNIKGIEIYPPSILQKLNQKIDQVIIAIPSISELRYREIAKKIIFAGIPVFKIPSVESLTDSKARISQLIPIKFEDLLGREVIPADPKLLGPNIKDKVICITGAGGSIGKELSKQIIKLKPKKLILFEQSELNLYEIYQELIILNSNINVLPILGNCLNLNLVKSLFGEHNVEIVFHSAAYKHVPMVEQNPIQGIINNVYSTKNICTAARESRAKQVILISTDKAVRPSSVMGASKRLAELVVQAFALEELNDKNNLENEFTCYSMVRFGNVLGSSGSVIPLFLKQIKMGGPLTITHPEIIRYFMTIKEAASLVIQSSLLAKGGDVFLLDMGKPVKIIDLAKQMINLSGLSIKTKNNPNGDIEIISTGLRPGEKLFEELLVDNKSESTLHPLIFRAKEKSIEPKILWEKLETLENFLTKGSNNKALKYFSEYFPELNWK